ncbi:MAG: tetratricopeptide repeat protein [Segetibacter sp.]
MNTLLKPAALNGAYETNNDSLISEMAWAYGIASCLYEKMERAATYCLYAAKLDAKLGKPSESYKCYFLSSLLYNTRDYEKSLQYMQASIQRETDTSQGAKHGIINRYNTVALCYQRMEKFDSAFFFYDAAMRLAKSLNDTVWQATLSGNEGQIYYLQKRYTVAKPLLFYDYEVSKEIMKKTAPRIRCNGLPVPVWQKANGTVR